MTDIIEVEVFNKLFTSIAEEMGIILTRSSFSPNIKERRDYSCAIFDAHGELVAQAAHIPVHLGSMPMTLGRVLEEKKLRPDDIVIINDPFKGGSHLPDITMIEGVFHNGRPMFYVVNRAHHADIGGKTPGSMGPTTDIAEEGVLIPPTLFYKKGVLNSEFAEDLFSRVRTPQERQGDIKAQVAALSRGKKRLQELIARHDEKHLFLIIEELKNYAERLMRETIKQIPNGCYHFTDYLDDDGYARKSLPIKIKLTVDDKNILADFSKSADQIRSPLNTVESVTLSATIYVFQCLMGEGYPINQGSYRPLQIITRPGSILAAQNPAPVAAGNVETSQRIVDVLMGALSQAVPERIPAASCGSMNNIAIGGATGERQETYTYYETIGGGMGARPDRNGISGIHTHMTNTMNTPIEAIEHAYPFQVASYSLRKGSGGKGKFRGGNGIIRTYRFLEESGVSLLAERQNIPPYGLSGGRKARCGEIILCRGKKKTRLRGKSYSRTLPGDMVIIKTPGGGGWGSQ